MCIIKTSTYLNKYKGFNKEIKWLAETPLETLGLATSKSQNKDIRRFETRAMQYTE